MMLNLKKLVSKAEKKNKVKYFAYFEKGYIFVKDDTFRVFADFRPESDF
jgi:hypothetical protein